MKRDCMKGCRWCILCIKTHVKKLLCITTIVWLPLVAADMGKIPQLQDMAMQFILRYISHYRYFDDELEPIHELPPLMREMIAKEYFLRYDGILGNTPFVVSIKELLDAQRRTIKPSEGLVYLNFLHLCSVDGITQVPNIATATSCSLSFNSLPKVPVQLASVMPQLKELRLSANRLCQVHAADLAPFAELQLLSLQINRIASLPEDIFLYNPKLAMVNLQHNPIDIEQVRRIAKKTAAHRKGQNNSCILSIEITYNGSAGKKPLTIIEFPDYAEK